MSLTTPRHIISNFNYLITKQIPIGLIRLFYVEEYAGALHQKGKDNARARQTQATRVRAEKPD